MKIRFWGSTDDVTGSMTFLELDQNIVLLDCGLAQGLPETKKINAIPLPVPPGKISDVVITHAHLDHSGYLPRLVKKGFKGSIHCTPPTAKLIRIILMDSAHINEDDFYDEKDVEQTMHQVKIHEWNEPFFIHDMSVEFYPASHILGASSVLFEIEKKKILFSGDLGRRNDPILTPLQKAPKADFVIMESTYGGKIRTGNAEDELEHFLRTIYEGSRVGIIASFAVARAQSLLTLIYHFYQKHPDLRVRVLIDSPMMKEANKVYQQYSHLTLHPKEVFGALEKIESVDHQNERSSLKKKKGPLIILSSSGMLTGGRIGSHLENWHEDKKAILYLPGYQGAGTPGRSFIEGNRILYGAENGAFQWRGEVWNSEAFSSHADQDELCYWISPNLSDATIFLLHGESKAKLDLKKRLEADGSKEIIIPVRGQMYDI